MTGPARCPAPDASRSIRFRDSPSGDSLRANRGPMSAEAWMAPSPREAEPRRPAAPMQRPTGLPPWTKTDDTCASRREPNGGLIRGLGHHTALRTERMGLRGLEQADSSASGSRRVLRAPAAMPAGGRARRPADERQRCPTERVPPVETERDCGICSQTSRRCGSRLNIEIPPLRVDRVRQSLATVAMPGNHGTPGRRREHDRPCLRQGCLAASRRLREAVTRAPPPRPRCSRQAPCGSLKREARGRLMPVPVRPRSRRRREIRRSSARWP